MLEEYVYSSAIYTISSSHRRDVVGCWGQREGEGEGEGRVERGRGDRDREKEGERKSEGKIGDI